MNKFAQEIYQANLRIERVIWLAGVHQGFESFEDFTFDVLDDSSHHPSMAWVEDVPQDALEDEEEFLCFLTDNEIYGVIVRCSTPIPTSFSQNGKSWSDSWGYYTSIHIYVEDLAEVVPLARAWANETFEEHKAKHLSQLA